MFPSIPAVSCAGAVFVAALPCITAQQLARPLGCDNLDDATSLLHTSAEVAEEIETGWEYSPGDVFRSRSYHSELEARLGWDVDFQAVDLRADAGQVNTSTFWNSSFKTREFRLGEANAFQPPDCSAAQQSAGCCSPLSQQQQKFVWNTYQTGGGEWVHSGNFIRFNFHDCTMCNGSAHLTQTGVAWVYFNFPVATTLTVWLEGLAEAHYEYLAMWLDTSHLVTVQATQNYEGSTCQVNTCIMCNVMMHPRTITIPAGVHSLTVKVTSIDHLFHSNAYFAVFFSVPSPTCAGCACRGACSNHDAGAQAAGQNIGLTIHSCAHGAVMGLCTHSSLSRSFLSLFHLVCPVSCNTCPPDTCEQSDEVVVEELRSSMNLSVTGCSDARVRPLCDHWFVGSIVRPACPQTCLYQGCQPTPEPTPAPTGAPTRPLIADIPTAPNMDVPMEDYPPPFGSPNSVPPVDPPPFPQPADDEAPPSGGTPSFGVPSTNDDVPQAPASNESANDTPAHAQGDPHIVNLLGRSFDLRQPGKYTLIRLPKEGPPLLQLDALVQSVGNPCSVFITQVNLTGSLVEGDNVRVRASRQNPYEKQREEPTPFSIQTTAEQQWTSLASIHAGAEVLVKSYSLHGVGVEIKARRDPPDPLADGGDDFDDDDVEGFFIISVIAPRHPHHTHIKLVKRRAWFNVHVARLRLLGYHEVGGVLGTTEPEERWSEPTKACTRHAAGGDVSLKAHASMLMTGSELLAGGQNMASASF